MSRQILSASPAISCHLLPPPSPAIFPSQEVEGLEGVVVEEDPVHTTGMAAAGSEGGGGGEGGGQDSGEIGVCRSASDNREPRLRLQCPATVRAASALRVFTTHSWRPVSSSSRVSPPHACRLHTLADIPPVLLPPHRLLALTRTRRWTTLMRWSSAPLPAGLLFCSSASPQPAFGGERRKPAGEDA